MNAGAYDEQVRSIINGRLRGMGKRLSSYCDAVVAGGDIGELSREFTDDIDGSIEEGVRDAWAVSESMRREMQDEAKRRKRKAARDAAITAALLLALQSFLSRKERVMVEQMKEDFARQTRSAISLLSGDSKTQARQLAEYIKNPFRINIDKVVQSEGETPVLQPQPSLFSRMRKILTTDIATAYRTAEYHVWQKLPFVVGQEVRLGKKHPVPDICDDLQGIYPKDFMFTGWHPWCRCFARPIFSWESDKITDMPECFNEWMVKNADRIERAREKGTLPQWMYDNRKYVKLKNRELSEVVRARRKEIRKEAKKLTNQTFTVPGFEKQLSISNKGIKEWINQPHKHYAEKNELLLDLKDILKHSTYMGQGIDRHNASIPIYLFETSIKGDKSWIIAREIRGEGVLVYSISDSEEILKALSRQ